MTNTFPKKTRRR